MDIETLDGNGKESGPRHGGLGMEGDERDGSGGLRGAKLVVDGWMRDGREEGRKGKRMHLGKAYAASVHLLLLWVTRVSGGGGGGG